MSAGAAIRDSNAWHNRCADAIDTVESELAVLNLDAGEYTPTLTGIANVASSAAYGTQWLRISRTVIVAGVISVDPTAAGVDTQLRVSLPVASDIQAVTQLGGSGASGIGGAAGTGYQFKGDTANDAAILQFYAFDAANQDVYFTFGYRIL